MPYNTRRKSLSLPSLGIHLPANSRALQSSRSPPAVIAATGTTSTRPAITERPPSKKLKRSHRASSSTLSSFSIAQPPVSQVKIEQRSKSTIRYEDTPPPSPVPSCEVRIDTQGINDDVVTGVIEQLEKTGNKPQLVKELASVLCNSLNIVESSANPQAIISSRLNAYLRRPWTALAPCPIAKTLIPTHPRRIYFYLTNTPHQPLPHGSSESPLPSNRRSAVISPSLSSDEDAEGRKRAALSPSPEVDLGIHEDLDDMDAGPPTPAGSFSGQSSVAPEGSYTSSSGVEVIGRSHRAISPPLEGDEKEFTQTACAMQSKSSLGWGQPAEAHERDTVRFSTEGGSGEGRTTSTVAADETEESAHARNFEVAAALFGHAQTMAAAGTSTGLLSSPVVRPSITHPHAPSMTMSTKRFSLASSTSLMEIDCGRESSLHVNVGWANDMVSPEKVNLDDLDDMFGEVF